MRLRPMPLARPWNAIFIAGAMVAVAYVVLPYSSTTELVLYDGVVVLAVVASVFGWRRAGTGRRVPWVLSSIALLGFLVGELLWWGYAFAGQDPFPSPADVFFLVGYIPLGIAAALLVSSRERESDRKAWLDAGILVAVAGLLVWDRLMEPYTGDPTVGPVSLAVTLAYPLADLLVLGLVIRLLLSRTGRNPAVTMFTLGVAVTLVADLTFAWQDLAGSFVSGSWLDAAYLLGYLLIAFAPLHLAVADETHVGEGEGMGRGRLAIVLGAVVVPQIVLLSALAGNDLLGPDTITFAVFVSMAVMVLIAGRLWGLLGRARRAEERRGEERLSAFVLHSADAILLVDEDWRISFASPAAARLLDTGGDTCLGQSLVDVFAAESRESAARQLGNVAAMPTGATVPLDGRIRTARGQALAVEGTGCNLLADESVRGVVVTLRDVTARIELEEQLNRRAFHDDLTGLANRALFADRLAHALDSVARDDDVHVAVLFVDLDDFKAVNDGMGHSAGDELIRGVAARLRVGLRPGDTVARLGGDEFAVLLERVSSPEYAGDVATRMLELLRLPIEVAGISLAVPASVGVTLATNSSTVESLLRDADIAMYTAKSQGKGRVAMFDERLREIASRRLSLKVELPDALRLGQFRLDYQPIVGVDDGIIAGFEALIRWHHPERGLVAPMEFIPAAEESGAIVDIGAWVLEEACRQAVVWNHDSPRPLSMSVNVSAFQLHNPGFVDLLRSVLESTGLPASLVTLELTESVLVDHDRVAAILDELRTVGVGIAIDDFGTGYSSLSYLQDLPVTSVKVDRSFVAQLTANGDSGLVKSILSLAEALGLSTVAEGVETPRQLEALSALECPLIQGFYTGYPTAPEDIADLLRRQPQSAPDPTPGNGRQPAPARSPGRR